MPPPSPHTPPAELAAVASALDTAEQALRANQPDALPGVMEGLARALQDCQRRLRLPDGASALDADSRLALAAIGQRLTTLQQHFHRQAGSVQRRLAVLFPTEQVDAYTRLGRGPAGSAPRPGGQTSFKA